jgi:hypothetical protein
MENGELTPYSSLELSPGCWLTTRISTSFILSGTANAYKKEIE